MSKKQSKKRNNKKVFKIILAIVIVAIIVGGIIVVRYYNGGFDNPKENYDNEIISYERVYDDCEYGYARLTYPVNKDLDYRYVDEVKNSDNAYVKTYEYKDFKIQTIQKGNRVAKTLKLLKNGKEVYSNDDVYTVFSSLYCVKNRQGLTVYKADTIRDTEPIVYNNKLYFLAKSNNKFTVRYDVGLATTHYYAIKYIDLSDNNYKDHVFAEYPGY